MSESPASMSSLAEAVEEVARVAGDVALGYYKSCLLYTSDAADE